MGNVLVSSVNTRQLAVWMIACPAMLLTSGTSLNEQVGAIDITCVTVDVGFIGPDNEQPAHALLAWRTWRPGLEKAHAAHV